MRQIILWLFIVSFVCAAHGQTYQDIYVADKVMVQRTTLGGPSSRMIAVGHPGGFNYAFDAVRCSPTYAWFGGFLDFSGETNGRGGKGSKILGVKRTLGTDPISLRVGNAQNLPESLEFIGYRRDSVTGNPTFMIEVDGVFAEQTLSSNEQNQITIGMEFSKLPRVTKYFLLDPLVHSAIELSEGLRWSTSGVIEIPAGQQKAEVTIFLKTTSETFVRKTPDLSGTQVFQNFCSACHSTDGTKLIGPTFKGLFGRNQTIIRDGVTESITVDEAYLLESILKPQAAVVKGFEMAPMADFSTVITDEQIDGLIGFLRELE